MLARLYVPYLFLEHIALKRICFAYLEHAVRPANEQHARNNSGDWGHTFVRFKYPVSTGMFVAFYD